MDCHIKSSPTSPILTPHQCTVFAEPTLKPNFSGRTKIKSLQSQHLTNASQSIAKVSQYTVQTKTASIKATLTDEETFVYFRGTKGPSTQSLPRMPSHESASKVLFQETRRMSVPCARSLREEERPVSRSLDGELTAKMSSLRRQSISSLNSQQEFVPSNVHRRMSAHRFNSHPLVRPTSALCAQSPLIEYPISSNPMKKHFPRKWILFWKK